jgi:Chemoreceptor zinc-binding domain
MGMLIGLAKLASRMPWLDSLPATGVETRTFCDTVVNTLPPPSDHDRGLDFGQAMRAHAALTQRLRDQINGAHAGLLDIDRIGRANCGRLGRWLHGTGEATYGHLASYRRLALSHRSLHAAAADVLRLHRSGQTRAALLQLETGLYARYAEQVEDLLKQFYLDRGGRVTVCFPTIPPSTNHSLGDTVAA